MIQDIAPHTFTNAFSNLRPVATSVALSFTDRSVLLNQENGAIRFPRFHELIGDDLDNAIYLFSIDEDTYFLLPQAVEHSGEYCYTDISLFRTAFPRHAAFAGITAYSLYKWYDNHRYCSHCGSLMRPHPSERALHCEACHAIEYPKIMPAVIVAVTNGNRILLSKYANREYTRHALLAGYTEIGESAEQTVHREVMEEVGLRVKNLRYYKSQPWAFSDTLLMGFFAEVDGSDIVTLDRDELSLAEWYAREDIPPTDSDISLTSEMIEYFRHGGPVDASKPSSSQKK